MSTGDACCPTRLQRDHTCLTGLNIVILCARDAQDSTFKQTLSRYLASSFSLALWPCGFDDSFFFFFFFGAKSGANNYFEFVTGALSVPFRGFLRTLPSALSHGHPKKVHNTEKKKQHLQISGDSRNNPAGVTKVQDTWKHLYTISW